MNRDFVEMLSALSASSVEYMVVGAHALAAHGRPRATGDLDIWVRPTAENAERVMVALTGFGAPLHDLTTEDLARAGTVFQIGVPPCRIDLMTQIDGVSFEDAWANHISVQIADVETPVIGRDDLLTNKKAAGRPKDLGDVAWLESTE